MIAALLFWLLGDVRRSLESEQCAGVQRGLRKSLELCESLELLRLLFLGWTETLSAVQRFLPIECCFGRSFAGTVTI